MHSANVTETNLDPITQFMTCEELVVLRKPPEQSQPSSGAKFFTCSETSMEKEAVECALETHKDLLSTKRGARICDLIKAEWNKELKAVVTDKLKGKFSQHMGKKIDDKIALSTVESLFLLENGCIKILNGKVEICTEEAYALMLKETMSCEEYQVYSYLSQLGYLVVPHQKELHQEASKSDKTVESRKNKRKRMPEEPLPDESNHKRITFSGALAENDSIISASDDLNVNSDNPDVNSDKLNVNGNNNVLPPTDVAGSNISVDDNTLTNDKDVLLSTDQELEPQTLSNETSESQSQVNQMEESDRIVKEAQSNLISEEAPSTTCIEIENLESNTVLEEQSSEKEKNTLKEVPKPCIEEMNIDSESSEMLIDAEKPAETENKFNEETDNASSTHASDLPESSANPTIDVNEQSMDVMSCSSNSASYDDSINGENSGDVSMDDEVTLLEVTKKETTPLAVIDLLSDDEQEQTREGSDSSDSDDEIKIIKVCNGTVENGKNQTDALLTESKIKTRKIINCKMEGRSSQNVSETVQQLQFPDLYRKNLVCVARPFSHLVPLNISVHKEVYVLNLNKNSSAHSDSRPQPQGRVWNSFREMQEYQRARRRNRHSNFPRSRFHMDKSLNHQNSQHFDGFLRNRRQAFNQRQTFNQINGSSTRSSWSDAPNQTTDLNCDNPHNSRLRDVDYRDQSLLREPPRDMGYRSHDPSEDRKPIRVTDSSLPFTPYSSLNNPTNPIPRFTNSASVNSVISIGHTGLEFGSQPVNPLHMNNYSDTISNRELIPSSSFLGNQDFVTQVHRTAYSYATTMLSSMLGPAFNPNNLPPFAPGRSVPPFGPPFPNSFGGSQYNSNRFSYMQNMQHFGDYRPRPAMQNPFPSMGTKRSWNDVVPAVGLNDGSSNSDSSDIEEIPINLNEFLWNVSNICPLVKPGVKHQISALFEPLKRTRAANLTDKNIRNDKCFPEKPSLKITFDVYLPGVNFKKSCPGTPKFRIIVVSALCPIPNYNELAILQRQYNDGVKIQIAVVNDGDICFCSFKSLHLPDLSASKD